MHYFEHAETVNMVIAHEIFMVVESLKPFARKKYGDNYQDAMDATYMHVLKHYKDLEGANLEHYTTSIMSKILMNSHKHESVSDMQTQIEADKRAVENDGFSNPESILTEGLGEQDGSFEECVQFLIPRFIHDHEIWAMKKIGGKNDHEDYTGIFRQFSVLVIYSAMEYLLKDFYEEAKYIDEFAKDCPMRRFSGDRYKDSWDNDIVYEGMVNDIAVCRFKNTRIRRYIYSIDIQSLLDDIVKTFYQDGMIGYRKIHTVPVYVSFSGQICYSLEELKSNVENELLGAMFARVVSLNCIDYDRGKRILLSSSKVDEVGIIFNIFETKIQMPLRKHVVRKVYD